MYEEKKLEVSSFKSSLKNSDGEISSLKKDLGVKLKELKEKDKVICKLEHKCENLSDSNKRLKTEINQLKTENRKISKSKSKVTKVVPTSTTTDTRFFSKILTGISTTSSSTTRLPDPRCVSSHTSESSKLHVFSSQPNILTSV